MHMKPSTLSWENKMPFSVEALPLDKAVDRRNCSKRLEKSPVAWGLPDRPFGDVIQIRYFPLVRSQITKLLLTKEIQELLQGPGESLPDGMVVKVRAARLAQPIKMKPAVLDLHQPISVLVLDLNAPEKLLGHFNRKP